ncbi:MAG: META domain-containing protein [Gemmatimonadota bacterium]|nr:META domain-containing protein [Gemmatimonadota bacterium]
MLVLKRSRLIVLGAAFLLAACDTPLGVDSSRLVGTEWSLTRFQTADGSVVEVPHPGMITVRFLAEGQVGGRAICSAFRGVYRIGRYRIKLEQLVPESLPSCVVDAELENAYLMALDAAHSYEQAVEGLLLLRFGHGGVLTYQRIFVAL